MTDTELLRRMQRGDRDALATFYARYLPTVWRFVHARLPRDTAAAQDVLSETFVAAIGAVWSLDLSKGTAGGWLIGIARHKLADWHRKYPRAVNAGEPEEPAARETIQALEEAELRAAVAGVLDGMDEDQRLALEWKYIEGRSVRDIGERLERSEKAVEALLYRARAEFRRRYEAGTPSTEGRGHDG
jgi:RNA polymerase sigma-70 factor (ECF subfamily)